MGDNIVAKAIGMGSIIVEVVVRGKIKRIHIHNAPHVPNLQANLLLVSKVLLNELKV